MGTAELSGHITANLFPWCLRGITTGLTVGDDGYFAHEDLLNAYRGSGKKKMDFNLIWENVQEFSKQTNHGASGP